MIDENEKTSCYLYVEEPAFKFTKRLPQQLEGDEGMSCEIECEIEDPDAECDWYFEGEKIVPEKEPHKYDVVVNDTKRKLIIKKCDPHKDRGRVECKCGVVTTGTEFFVRPALKVVKGLSDLEGVEEDTIELVVEVTKPNKNAKWIRNGRNITPNDERFANRYEVISQGCIHRLVIKNAQLKDTGEFVCNIDELSEKCNLKVKECNKQIKINKKNFCKNKL